MVSNHFTADEKHPIILNKKSRDASCHHQAQNTDIQIGLDEASPLAVGVPPARPATQSLNNSRYFTKFTAVAVIAASYIVSSASAFTQPQNKIGATPISRQPLISSLRTENDLPSFTSKTQLFMGKAYTRPNKERDTKEWKAIFLALQLYKAAFGDLKIQKKFVVPSAAPWPEAAWGMKLGERVVDIRHNGRYIENNLKRRQQLDKLGFLWSARAPVAEAKTQGDDCITFDQIYDALTVYRSEIKQSGSLTVPKGFFVPDTDPWPENTRGLPLGRCMDQLKSKAYLKENPGAEEKLQQIGFETVKKLSANDKRFQAVYLALERYKETYGDLLVPQPFVVPDSSDWPKESRGLRLGARVNAIRSQGTFVKNNSERQDMLDSLGFVWTPPEKDTRKRGRKTLDQIDEEEKEAFLEASGTNAAISPESATISGEKNGEEDDADSFLSFFDFNENDQDTEGESASGQPTWGLEAGREYEGFGNNNKGDASQQEVDDDYEAPRTLGESLSAARERALEAKVIEDTDSKRPTKSSREPTIPWFNDDFGGYFVFEDVVEALTLYKDSYSDFSNLTSGDFVIPVMEEPEHSFDDDFEDDIDPRFADEASMTDDDIEAEIARLESNMLAQEDGTEWPEHLEGMRLGDIVKRIRDGSLEVKHIPERKAKLDEIDFDWGDEKYFLDVPFEKAMCAMYAFYMVRGDMFVPPDYVMPDEDPWPRALAGYELGKAVKRIRELQNFFEAFHVEKVGLLRMIDFVWFPTLALPIDPNEPELSPEMLLLGAMGHPDYHQLDEIPMGLPEKIMGDGPFHVSDDPRQWWRTWHNWDYVADIWRSMGTKDRAAALRKQGYHKMAKEHEEKYGPGLFQQIDKYLENILAEMESGELEGMIGREDTQTFFEVADTFKELSEKWDDMTEEERKTAPGDYLTDFTLHGREGGLPSILKLYTDTFEENERQRIDLPDHLLDMRDTLFSYLDELVDCTDIDDYELSVLWRFRIRLYLSLPLHDHFDASNKEAIDEQKLNERAKEMTEMKDQLDSQLMTFDLNGSANGKSENSEEEEYAEDDADEEELDDEAIEEEEIEEEIEV